MTTKGVFILQINTLLQQESYQNLRLCAILTCIEDKPISFDEK